MYVTFLGSVRYFVMSKDSKKTFPEFTIIVSYGAALRENHILRHIL